MKYLLFGINHKSADVSLLERCFFDHPRREELRLFLQQEVDEVVVLQTCNRLECYIASTLLDWEKIQEMVEFFLKLESEEFERHFYVKQDFACVSHLLLVATSLDSVVVGEAQILGQIRKSYLEASRAGYTGKYLSRLFETAVRVGKRVRAETAIARGAVSVSQAAVELAKKHFPDLQSLNVLVIGAGQTGRLALQHILNERPQRVVLTNRTRANAEKLAELFAVEVLDFAEFRHHLAFFDIIIAAVDSSEYLLSRADFQPLAQKPEVFVADISLPRVIDPQVGGLPFVKLFDIFDLQNVRDKNLEQRLSEKERVQEILHEELENCRNWYETQALVPLISRIEEWKNNMVAQELEKQKQKLAVFTAEQQQLLKRMLHSCMNKSIHLSYCLLKNGFSEGRIDMSSKIVQTVSDILDKENNK